MKTGSLITKSSLCYVGQNSSAHVTVDILGDEARKSNCQLPQLRTTQVISKAISDMQLDTFKSVSKNL
jgi:hypothetical protein